MNKRNIFVIVFILVVLLIVAASFLVRMMVPEQSVVITQNDRAAMVYERANELWDNGESDKAVAAFFTAVNQYPDTEYAEKSLRKLASIYREKGDYSKSNYYYKRLLADFPGIEDGEQIKTMISEINMKIIQSPSLTEDSVEYTVQPGDSLYAMAMKFGTTVELIKKINGLSSDMIRVGQKLKIVVSKFSIIVDKSKNTLILKKDGEFFKAYYVSTGKDGCTPTGIFTIQEKMVKPVWYKVDAIVSPDSEQYELGERWMGLSIDGYGIHGTADESTIGGYVTQGCVRMKNNDVVELFDIVPSGTQVEIVDIMENNPVYPEDGKPETPAAKEAE